MQHQLAPSVGIDILDLFVFPGQMVEWFELGQGLPAQATKRVGMLQAIPTRPSVSPSDATILGSTHAFYGNPYGGVNTTESRIDQGD